MIAVPLLQAGYTHTHIHTHTHVHTHTHTQRERERELELELVHRGIHVQTRDLIKKNKLHNNCNIITATWIVHEGTGVHEHLHPHKTIQTVRALASLGLPPVQYYTHTTKCYSLYTPAVHYQ